MKGIGALVLDLDDNVATVLRDVGENEVLVCDRLGETIKIKVLEKIVRFIRSVRTVKTESDAA